MLHIRRCSAVQIHQSSRNSAPPSIRRQEALQKTGGSSPPSAGDVVVVVSRHSAPTNCSVVCRTVTRLVVLLSLPAPTARELTGIRDRRLVLPAKLEFPNPREPPDPPIPPDPPPRYLSPASYIALKTLSPYFIVASPELWKSRAAKSDAPPDAASVLLGPVGFTHDGYLRARYLLYREKIKVFWILKSCNVLSVDEFNSTIFHPFEHGRIFFPLMESGRIPVRYAGNFKVTW
ncbi:unnamed protein product [Arabis nemorensis]|uniref:Uncharacterized protein n=1 Tax=Arabis nemorensis TaxID=586526 RepID=A0A565CRM7_9BRAS|nr:unnamed protein product [Arabis nemorensis]